MTKEVTHTFLWSTVYQADQDRSPGFAVVRFQINVDATNPDRGYVPIGIGVEARVRDGFVLAGLVRDQVSASERKILSPSLRECAQVPGIFWVRDHLVEVQRTPPEHKPDRRPYLARACDQHMGYQMSSLFAGHYAELPTAFCLEYGLKESMTRRAALRNICGVLKYYEGHSFLASGVARNFML